MFLLGKSKTEKEKKETAGPEEEEAAAALAELARRLLPALGPEDGLGPARLAKLLDQQRLLRSLAADALQHSLRPSPTSQPSN